MTDVLPFDSLFDTGTENQPPPFDSLFESKDQVPAQGKTDLAHVIEKYMPMLKSTFFTGQEPIPPEQPDYAPVSPRMGMAASSTNVVPPPALGPSDYQPATIEPQPQSSDSAAQMSQQQTQESAVPPSGPLAPSSTAVGSQPAIGLRSTEGSIGPSEQPNLGQSLPSFLYDAGRRRVLDVVSGAADMATSIATDPFGLTGYRPFSQEEKRKAYSDLYRGEPGTSEKVAGGIGSLLGLAVPAGAIHAAVGPAMSKLGAVTIDKIMGRIPAAIVKRAVEGGSIGAIYSWLSAGTKMTPHQALEESVIWSAFGAATGGVEGALKSKPLVAQTEPTPGGGPPPAPAENIPGQQALADVRGFKEFQAERAAFDTGKDQLIQMHAGVSIPEVAQSMADISESTAKLVKHEFGEPEPGIRGFLNVAEDQHKAWRDYNFQTGQMKSIVEKTVPEPARQVAIIDAFQHPKNAEMWDNLDASERGIAEWMGREMDKGSELADKLGIEKLQLPDGIRYLPQVHENPITGEAYSQGYGKFSKSTPRSQPRATTETGEVKYPTYADSRAGGLKMATTNIGELAGNYLQSLGTSWHAKQFMKSLKRGIVESDVGKEGTRLGMNWSDVKKTGQQEDFVYYDGLQNFRVVDSNEGMVKIVDSPMGINKQIYPWVRNYMENPTPGTLSKMIAVSKQWSLGYALFHPISVTLNNAVLGNRWLKTPYDMTIGVAKGVKMWKEFDPEIRALYRNGLKTHRYLDIQEGSEYQFKSPFMRMVEDVVKLPSKFTMQYYVAGMKTHFAYIKLKQLLPEYLDKGLTLDDAARDVVKLSDRLFSSEDIQRAVLESHRFMNQTWYSPKGRTYLRNTLISPTWLKAHFGFALNDVPKAFYRIAKGEAKPIDKVYIQALGGAAALYSTMNLYNYVATKEMDGEGKWMFQNPPGKKFSLRAAWNEPDGREAFWRPAKSVFEVPEFVADPIGKTFAKVTPVVMGVMAGMYEVHHKEYLKAVGSIGGGLLPIGVGSAFFNEGMTPKENVSKLSSTSSMIGIPMSKGPYADPRKQKMYEGFKREYDRKQEFGNARNAYFESIQKNKPSMKAVIEYNRKYPDHPIKNHELTAHEYKQWLKRPKQVLELK